MRTRPDSDDQNVGTNTKKTGFFNALWKRITSINWNPFRWIGQLVAYFSPKEKKPKPSESESPNTFSSEALSSQDEAIQKAKFADRLRNVQYSEEMENKFVLQDLQKKYNTEKLKADALRSAMTKSPDYKPLEDKLTSVIEHYRKECCDEYEQCKAGTESLLEEYKKSNIKLEKEFSEKKKKLFDQKLQLIDTEFENLKTRYTALISQNKIEPSEKYGEEDDPFKQRDELKNEIATTENYDMKENKRVALSMHLNLLKRKMERLEASNSTNTLSSSPYTIHAPPAAPTSANNIDISKANKSPDGNSKSGPE